MHCLPQIAEVRQALAAHTHTALEEVSLFVVADESNAVDPNVTAAALKSDSAGSQPTIDDSPLPSPSLNTSNALIPLQDQDTSDSCSLFALQYNLVVRLGSTFALASTSLYDST